MIDLEYVDVNPFIATRTSRYVKNFLTQAKHMNTLIGYYKFTSSHDYPNFRVNNNHSKNIS